MITKLVIYDDPRYKTPVFYCVGTNTEGHVVSESWCGISKESAKTTPIKAVYEGKDAAIKMWEIGYEKLDKKQQQTILAVFPDLLTRDKSVLRPACKLIEVARSKIRRDFGITCPRCGGSGSYARSVAWTEVDNGVCHLCGGSGKRLPPLTNKKLAEITAHFASKKATGGVQ